MPRNQVEEERLNSGIQLNDTCVLAQGHPRVVLRLRARKDHVPRRKNQCRLIGIAVPHDDGGKTLGVSIFRIPSAQRDGLQVKSAVQIHSSDDVSEGRNNALYSGDVRGGTC